MQEVEVLKLVSYDRNVVQFYGTCPYGTQTMLVLEYLEVKHDCCQNTMHHPVMHINITDAEDRLLLVIILVYLLEAKSSCTCMGSLTGGKHWIAKAKLCKWLCTAGWAFAAGPD